MTDREYKKLHKKRIPQAGECVSIKFMIQKNSFDIQHASFLHNGSEKPFPCYPRPMPY